MDRPRHSSVHPEDILPKEILNIKSDVDFLGDTEKCPNNFSQFVSHGIAPKLPYIHVSDLEECKTSKCIFMAAVLTHE
jgi:hypothetical protein